MLNEIFWALRSMLTLGPGVGVGADTGGGDGVVGIGVAVGNTAPGGGTGVAIIGGVTVREGGITGEGEIEADVGTGVTVAAGEEPQADNPTSIAPMTE